MSIRESSFAFDLRIYFAFAYAAIASHRFQRVFFAQSVRNIFCVMLLYAESGKPAAYVLRAVDYKYHFAFERNAFGQIRQREPYGILLHLACHSHKTRLTRAELFAEIFYGVFYIVRSDIKNQSRLKIGEFFDNARTVGILFG